MALGGRPDRRVNRREPSKVHARVVAGLFVPFWRLRFRCANAPDCQPSPEEESDHSVFRNHEQIVGKMG